MGKPKPGTKSSKKEERKNTGKRGSRKNPQTPIANVLMRKGAYRSLKMPNRIQAWQGTTIVSQPFDPEQSRINKELGYW